MRKISLEEIAAATKIGTRHLRSLEEEDFKKLPGGIFNKGFVRAYARFLGINEDQAVSDYLAAAGEPENQTTEIMVDQLVAQQEAEKKARARSRELETINRSETGIPWGAIAGLVLIVAMAAGGWTYYTRYRARVEAGRAQKAEPTPTIAQPVESPAVTTPLPPQPQTAESAAPVAPFKPSAGGNAPQGNAPVMGGATAAPPAPSMPAPGKAVSSTSARAAAATDIPAGEGFVVSIRATKPAWISVTADGKHMMSLNLTPSDAKSIRARNTILLLTGNAGGVDISFNGKPIPALGGDGEVRKATFTPGGIQP